MTRDLDFLSQEIKSIGAILMQNYNEYQIQILNAREWMHEQLYVPDAPSYKPAVFKNFINKIKIKGKFLRKT
ncbi:hypothetical protein [Acetobacter sp. DsW_063]|uniref:hypothetical protein n=1 Tax=Acetobacter sp. DsW_063 TaxID=1514894 RepID=UPI00117889A0|nr:hypothetical protein [Acetobacter sp. DsW_063]